MVKVRGKVKGVWVKRETEDGSQVEGGSRGEKGGTSLIPSTIETFFKKRERDRGAKRKR